MPVQYVQEDFYMLVKQMKTRRNKLKHGGGSKDRILGIYDKEYFINKTVRIYGDVEGAQNDSICKTIETVEEGKKITKLEMKINDNEVVVLLGDLVDMSKYDIRLLKMVKESWEKNKNLICLIGNRDINKIRVRDESYIVKTIEKRNEICWYDMIRTTLSPNFNDSDLPTYTFYNLCTKIAKDELKNDYKFAYFGDHLTDRYNINYNDSKRFALKGQPTHWDGIVNKLESYNNNNNLERIKVMYNDLLGASDVLSNRIIELFELGFITNEQMKEIMGNNNLKYVCIALTNMMMTIPLDLALPMNHQKSNSPLAKMIKYLAGLHLDYLNGAHIIALLNCHNEKVLCSHSGLPPYLSSPLGYGFSINEQNQIKSLSENSILSTITSLSDIIIGINEEKNRFITLFSPSPTVNLPMYANNSQNYHYQNFIKYVQLSALTGVINYNDKYNKYSAGTYYSPITNHGLNRLVDMPLFSFKALQGLSGGKIWSDMKVPFGTIYVYDAMTRMKKDITMNVFGHQPQGLFPCVIKDEKSNETEKDVYHVGLDISMMNRKSYLESGAYACLVLAPPSPVVPEQAIKTIKGAFYLGDKENKYNIHVLVEPGKNVTHINNVANIGNLKTDSIYEYEDSLESFAHTINAWKEQNDEFLELLIGDNIINKSFMDDEKQYAKTIGFMDKNDLIDTSKKLQLFNKHVFEKLKLVNPKEPEESLINQHIMFAFCPNYYPLVYVKDAKVELKAMSSEGGKPKPLYKKTDGRITWKNRKLIVYAGKRGGKYVKIKGEFVSVRNLHSSS